jgi:hypothetical protein
LLSLYIKLLSRLRKTCRNSEFLRKLLNHLSLYGPTLTMIRKLSNNVKKKNVAKRKKNSSENKMKSVRQQRPRLLNKPRQLLEVKVPSLVLHLQS